jgi:CRISPR type III-associated protein (TIGR04423 family)
MIKVYDIKNPELIPHERYTGYLWFSDGEIPVTLKDQEIPYEKIGLNPFIIEGHLWDRINRRSYTILHTGSYNITCHELPDGVDELNDERSTYIPHRLSGVKKVIFSRIWEAQPDPECLGMDVMSMKALVFKGFQD